VLRGLQPLLLRWRPGDDCLLRACALHWLGVPSGPAPISCVLLLARGTLGAVYLMLGRARPPWLLAAGGSPMELLVQCGRDRAEDLLLGSGGREEEKVLLLSWLPLSEDGRPTLPGWHAADAVPAAVAVLTLESESLPSSTA
jgi:hypothetical protein